MDNHYAGFSLPADLAASFAERSVRLTVAAGKIIVGHTDKVADAFLVESGTAQVSLLAVDGKEAIFRDLGPGELFGEMSAIDGQPRSATVLAKSQLTVLKMDSDSFVQWLGEAEGAGLWIARLLVSRMREMTDKVFELATMPVTRRIQIELLRLAATGQAQDNQVIIKGFPTHYDIAARIGTHRETVSRELGWLRENGIVSTKGRTLTVLDLNQLRHIASF